MLASAQVQQLVEKAKINRILYGSLLPLNNNKCYLNLLEINSVTVVVDDPAMGAVPVALGIINKCSANQLYCSLAVTSPNYENVYVKVERVKRTADELGLVGDGCDGDDGMVKGCDVDSKPIRHSVYKISEVVEEVPDLSGLPQYFSAFVTPPARPLLQCVIDELIEQTVGHVDVDMKRNITVDLYDPKSSLRDHSDTLWRDYGGFVVGDRFRYGEVEIARSDFLSLLSRECSGDQKIGDLTYEIKPITEELFDLVLDYDHSLTLMNRQDHLEYLFHVCGVSGSIAIDSHQQPIGYIFTHGQYILQCYAQEQGVANQLLKSHVERRMGDQKRVVAHLRFDNHWLAEKLAMRAVKVRRVQRIHTRIVPNSVKDHSKIFVYSMGVHLF